MPIVSVAKQLLTATGSSAGVERVFSSFGLVHSKLRNRLGIAKAGKLVFLFKLLNKSRWIMMNLMLTISHIWTTELKYFYLNMWSSLTDMDV
jgi:hypothetical protein